ncbi:MAG: hypothetical protein KGY56_01215 [Desulfobacterales bacterium]|nr:hypothetical protein [Desulfobacterales bacterium]
MSTSGDIYLCQVSQTVSCGACCGLYNLAVPSRQGIRSLLERRTAAFARVPREMAAVLDFGQRESEALSKNPAPMPEFHHCPYLGFIGRKKSRVGCLLHPRAENNNGIDLRGLSHYGSMTCQMYFCPTHRRIAPDFKRILRSVIDDWYLFGLVIQEKALLSAFYEEITRRCRSSGLDPAAAFRPHARKLWDRLFGLKISWPYAADNSPLANYFFNDELYPKPQVDYSAAGSTGSRYDAIFRELHSVFASKAELSAAEQLLDGLFAELAGTVCGSKRIRSPNAGIQKIFACPAHNGNLE